MSDTVELATESGFECPCGGGGELFLDGERREEKRDREEGRRADARRRGPFVPRPSTSEDRSTNRRRRKTEAFEVEVGKRSAAEGEGGEWRLAGLRLPARSPLGGGKCWKDQKMRAPAPKKTVTQTIEGARKENRWMGKEQRRS